MTVQVIVPRSCLDIPFELVDKAHVMITDPPYSEYVHKNITSAGTMGDKSRGWHRQDLAFGSLTPELRRRIAQFAACVQRWSLIFSDIESAHLWRHALQAAASQFIRSVPAICEGADDPGYSFALPWVRWSQPQKSGDRPTQGAELVTHAWTARGGRKSWNGPGGLVEYKAKALRGSDKHRTQKPLLLMLQQVSWFSNPGETVIDPCAGRGTTGVACRLLDRDFWGCEIDPEEEDRATSRLESPLDSRDLSGAQEFIESQREEARAQLALPRTRHPKTGEYTDEQTRARAQRRLDDADRVARNIA